MGLLTEPNPLTFLKVRPGVEFFFRFLMPDVIPFGNGGSLSADVVSDLFQQILLDLGAGAKTNQSRRRGAHRSFPRGNAGNVESRQG